MAAEHGAEHSPPGWFVAPGEGDVMAWIALGFMVLAIYGIVVLYSAFDRWAEHQSKGTPLAKTIPTMLAIALLYEVFPLDHFNILLPLSAILLALMADWSRFHLLRNPGPVPQGNADTTIPETQDAPRAEEEAQRDV
ncbi:hypothetical protein [Amaricoccus tamworthensis]|uniref:hypothetical protein n=1 Tax=Amaricoccus tamworthensis TaxID=57002 RepID=UPI003C7DDCEB